MQLPASEEDDEKVVGIPKLFETSVGLSPALLDSKPNHNAEGGGHDPAGDTGSGREVENKELNRSRRRIWKRRVNGCEPAEVPHVGCNVDCGEDNDGPCSRNVELDVIIKRNDIVQWGLAEEGDEVPANWEQDEDNIEMEDERGGTGDCWTSARGQLRARVGVRDVPKPTLTIERVVVKVSLSW